MKEMHGRKVSMKEELKRLVGKVVTVLYDEMGQDLAVTGELLSVGEDCITIRTRVNFLIISFGAIKKVKVPCREGYHE